MQGWRNYLIEGSRTSRRTVAPRAVARAASLGVLIALLQGCSSTSDTQLAQPGGAPPPGQASQQNQPQPWRQPSTFDADGPPSATYRGGRDPVTGKAAEWSPNGPVETSAIAPLPSAGRPQAVARAAPPSRPASAGVGIGAGVGIQGMVKVRQGDTLESIARAHGITVTALMQANKMTGRSSLKVGQQLVVPQ